jgi:hypothetical protein
MLSKIFLSLVTISSFAHALPKECAAINNKLNFLATKIETTYQKNQKFAPSKNYINALNELMPELEKISAKHPDCKQNLDMTVRIVVEKLTAVEQKSKSNTPEKIEILEHDNLQERLDIGPSLVMGKIYQVHSLYVELYGGLCKPLFHKSGKILCDKFESLIKNIDFNLTTQEAKTKLYRSNKNTTDGCFTFQWTNYGKIRITDFKDGGCD